MSSNFGESESEEMPDLSLPVTSVQPYMYEPLSRNENNSETESEGESESGDEFSSDNEVGEEIDDASLWCTCNHCISMTTRIESKCCRDTNIVDGKIEEAEIQCITQHEGFQVNCLNQHVLETSFYEYVRENGPIEDNQIIHKVYKHIAYRRSVRWIYQYLGKKNRRVLPACVVNAIRNTFPSQQYCGFKYPV